MLPFKEYSEARDYYEVAKVRQRKLHEKVKAIMVKNGPILDFKELVILHGSQPYLSDIPM